MTEPNDPMPKDPTTLTHEHLTKGTRVVVGVDGSDSSLQALRWAAFLSGSLHVGLEAVTCWTWGSFGYAPYPSNWNPATEARTTLDQAVARVFGTESLPADLKVSVHEGSPAKTLLDLSADAGVLVVGSRGHGGFAGLLLGSVSEACSEHAVCPVLVVHAATPAPPAPA